MKLIINNILTKFTKIINFNLFKLSINIFILCTNLIL